MDLIASSIHNKLILISGTGTVTVLAAAFFGFWLSWNSIHTFQQEVKPSNAHTFAVLTMQADFKKQVQEWKDTLLRGSDSASLDKHWGNFEKMEQKVQTEGADLEKSLVASNSRNLLIQFLKAHQEMGIAYRKGLQAFRAAKFDSSVGDKAVKGMDRAPTELLTSAANELKSEADNSSSHAITNGYKGIKLSLALMGAAVLLAFITFMWFIKKGIVHPAKQLAQGLGHLAKGNFSIPIKQTTKDEMGMIAVNAESVRRDLGKIVSDVNQSASEVAGAASALATASSQVSIASQHQSEAASATAAAVEQMTVSIASVADSANEVSQLSTTSLENTRGGNHSLSRLAEGMSSVGAAVDEISQSVNQFILSSKTITDMTRQVKEIADQTNLLALNASIEAARAGEQGRGFAVVADEVRTLAEKSTKAASEIETVTQSLEQQSAIVEKSIHTGRQSLQSSQNSLESVKAVLMEAGESVLKTNEGIENIAAAVNEQKAASNEIAKHVEHIAQMAEENSAAIHQTSDATDHMEQLATQLQEVVKHFKT